DRRLGPRGKHEHSHENSHCRQPSNRIDHHLVPPSPSVVYINSLAGLRRKDTGYGEQSVVSRGIGVPVAASVIELEARDAPDRALALLDEIADDGIRRC